jgi:tetratricopeptide (TPR) repeat protein
MRPRPALRAFRLTAYPLAAVLALAPALARADGKGPAKKAAEAADKKSFRDAVSQGESKYASRDFPGAVEQFRKAIEVDPSNPLGHYLLGEAQLAAGNLTEAEASWNRASLEASDKEPVLRAKVLFVLADLKERQKKWEDAKAAWQMYIDWGASHPNAGVLATSGQSRQQVIDTMLKQDKAYEIVRQRIADSKNGTVFTDLSKSPK